MFTTKHISTIRAFPGTSAYIRHGSAEALQKLMTYIMSFMTDTEGTLKDSRSSVYKENFCTYATFRSKDGCYVDFNSERGWFIFSLGDAMIELGNNKLMNKIASYCASRA